MARVIEEAGLSFDDVLLVPKKTSVASRFGGEIDISTNLPGVGHLNTPIISANMDTITESNMANAMNALGGLGIVHRFFGTWDQVHELRRVTGPRVACVGIDKDAPARAGVLVEQAGCVAILIDVAHAHSDRVKDTIESIQQKDLGASIWVGNIATPQAALELAEWGVEVVKVGVGPGSLCTTRINTGCGVPQLTAVMEVCSSLKGTGVKVIADGGMKNSGDIVKALAAGADAVMLGGLFSGALETPGEIIQRIEHNHTHRYKKYRGMASKEFQQEVKGFTTSVEGESKLVPLQDSVQAICQSLVNGILSGMSYQGASNLNMLHENATFIKQSSAGYQESSAHGLSL